MHSPAMTALLGEQPEKGAPDALDVLGIGQHKSAKGPGGWHDDAWHAPAAAGAMEAQARKPVPPHVVSASSQGTAFPKSWPLADRTHAYLSSTIMHAG